MEMAPRWRGVAPTPSTQLQVEKLKETDAESARVVRRDLLHLFPFDAINLHAVRDADDDVLHDLGALGHGAAHLFGMGQSKPRRVADAPALASRSTFPSTWYVVHLK